MHLIAIPRRGFRCVKDQKPFKQGFGYFSVLEEHKGSYQREDYCEECWEQMAKERQGKIFWKAFLEPKAATGTIDGQKDQRALFLLKEMILKGAEEEKAQLFILALYLARRKKIVLRQQLTEAQAIVQLYEDVETEEILPVPKIPLSQLDIITLQQQLAKRL